MYISPKDIVKTMSPFFHSRSNRMLFIQSGIERGGGLWYAVFSYNHSVLEEVMVHILIGASAAAGFSTLVFFSRTRWKKIHWWQWLLTLFAFAYTTFVLELVISFLEEGAARGALVMGLVLGFIALIWAVLLGRFVFKKSKDSDKPSS